MTACLRRLLCSLALVLPALAWAHASSQAYLDLQALPSGQTRLNVDLALRDLDAALDLDADADGQLSWGEVKAARNAIERYALAGLALRDCAAGFTVQGFELANHPDGTYVRLQLHAPCALPASPALRYTALGEIDPTHRALLKVQRIGAAPELALLHPRQPVAWGSTSAAPAQDLAPVAQPTAADTAAAPAPNPLESPPEPQATHFWLEGITHLLTGYDHLLFLLCLLLPAGLRRGRPVATVREALWPLLGMVSAFTVSHSITLGLSVLGWVSLSPAVIEPLIAASIVLAALDNLWPFLERSLGLPRWGVAGAFGLVHGFGFAGALVELELPPGTLALALLQFNLGLEVAQVGVVALAGGVLLRLRHWPAYPRWILGLGSLASATLGGVWVAQRLT